MLNEINTSLHNGYILIYANSIVLYFVANYEWRVHLLIVTNHVLNVANHLLNMANYLLNVASCLLIVSNHMANCVQSNGLLCPITWLIVYNHLLLDDLPHAICVKSHAN